MKVIGLTGTIGSGKNTVKNIIKRKVTCFCITLSDIIRAEIERRKGTLTRATLQDMGNELREKYGNHILVKLAVDYLSKKKDVAVIDGIRNPGEIEYLRKRFGDDFKLIAIDAPAKIRFKRLKERGEEKDVKTWEEFIALDKRDQGEDEPEFGQHVKKCIEQADFLIINDGDERELEGKVERILQLLW